MIPGSAQWFNPEMMQGLSQGLQTPQQQQGIDPNALQGNYVQNGQDVQERYGLSQQQVTVDPKKPDEAAAQVTTQKQDFYKQFYEPLLAENSTTRLQDTSLVDAARENANYGFEQAQARTQREQRRYNMVGGRPGAVQAGQDQQMGLARSLNYDNSVNSARVELQDRNTAFRDEMINVYNGIDRSAQGGLNSAVANQKARDAANEQAKAAQKGSMYSTIGTAASIAAMFL